MYKTRDVGDVGDLSEGFVELDSFEVEDVWRDRGMGDLYFREFGLEEEPRLELAGDLLCTSSIVAGESNVGLCGWVCGLSWY